MDNGRTAARKRNGSRHNYIPLLIMALPGLLYIFINNYIPMFGIVIAFKDINFAKGILASDWVGFRNFRYLFHTKDAWIITRNTVLYNLVFITMDVVAAVSFAVLLSEMRQKNLRKIYQTIMFLPYLLSITVVSYLAYAFLSTDAGYLNNTVLSLLGREGISWYTDPGKWPFILTVTNLWKNVGYSCTIYFAAVVGIDPQYSEAAAIDGASVWQRIRHVTLPLLKPTVIMLVLLSVGRIFYSDFGLFYQVPMNSGMLYSTTNTIDTYVYRSLMKLNDVGMASAAGFYQSIVGFILVVAANGITRVIDRESALY